jgi:hypothetical protein
VVTRSGVTPVAALAERKKAWAAAMSRCSLSMVSTRLPSRSIARYRYAHRPPTFRYVFSIPAEPVKAVYAIAAPPVVP